MATIKVLRECVVAHKRRIPGELVEVDENTARRMDDEEPETFEWVDRPVRQFIDVVLPAPVVEDDLVLRQPIRQRRKKAEVSDGDESTG